VRSTRWIVGWVLVLGWVSGCVSGTSARSPTTSRAEERASTERPAPAAPRSEDPAPALADGIVPDGIAPDGTAPEAPRAWLYRVELPGVEPSYLLGTMHVGVDFRRAVPPPLDAAMLGARTVVMEIDLREAQRYFRDPPRSARRARVVHLHRALPRETWLRLTGELSYVATPAQITRVPAGMLAVYMRQVRMAEVEAAADGWDRVPGTASPTHLDRWIFDWALAARVPFVALETPEEAVAALSTFRRPSAIEALRRVVDEPEVARDAARRLREAYLSEDDAEVLAILSEMSAEERHATFEVRNQTWLARLVPVLEAGGAFVAVGLGHLLGDGSLVTVLRERGLTVERVLGDGGLVRTEGADDWVWTRATADPGY
jgi:hypothetical protein